MKINWKNTKNKMTLNTVNGVAFLTWDRLSEMGIVHGFSTRLGGVSKGYFSEMNLGFSTKDRDEDLVENFHIISKAIGFPIENMVMSHQTHTTNIKIVTLDDAKIRKGPEKDFHDIDGLVTSEKGVVLETSFADCVPLFFIDKKRRAIALVHSGWRGTVGKIAAKAIEILENDFGIKAEDLICAIGPSICQDCYEVSEDLIVEFKKAYNEKYWNIIFKADLTKDNKYRLDLWEANRIQFVEKGVREDDILMPGICTCCNPKFLHSHRYTKGKRGILGAFLQL